MNELVTGRAYVEAISAIDADRAYRSAFLELALSLAPPRASIFDFGCGPGLDARVYLDRGHEVQGFDVDANMCATFREACAREMLTRRAQLVAGSYDEFLAAASESKFDLVTSNFAPLNLVPDPAALFRKLGALLKPTGRALISVLNPWHRGDLRHGWWWRGLPQLLGRGHYAVPGAQAPITRWQPGRLAAAGGNALELQVVYAPSPAAGVTPRRVRLAQPFDWPSLSAARFLFLQWKRGAP